MEHTTLSAIEKTAGNIRKQILKIALDRGGCYLAQACSSAEIVATLYMEVLNLGPSQGAWRPAPFPGVPGPDNMDYQKGALYNCNLQRPGRHRPDLPGLHGQVQRGRLEYGDDWRGTLPGL